MDTAEVRNTPFQVGKSFLIAQYLIMAILVLKYLESLKSAFVVGVITWIPAYKLSEKVSFKVGFDCRSWGPLFQWTQRKQY